METVHDLFDRWTDHVVTCCQLISVFMIIHFL